MPLIRRNSNGTSPPDPHGGGNVLDALTRGTIEERWSAARAAAHLPGGLEALGRALASEENARVRAAILTSLAGFRCAESVQAILPHLRSDDASLRTGALDALRIMGKIVGPHLPILLNDPDPDVRLLACYLVRVLPSAEATRLLCDLLATESEPNVCAAALDVLAESGGAEALPVLQLCAERFPNDSFLRFAIKIASDRIASKPGT